MGIFKKKPGLFEKILIAVLAVLLVLLLYYQYVDKPIKTRLKNVKLNIADASDELDLVEMKAFEIMNMQNTMEAIEDSELTSYMPSYNGSREEIKFLNDVLSEADQYSVTFSDVTRKGDQIRRNFDLTFSVDDYAKAQKIIATLSDGEIRCKIGNVECSNINQSYVEETKAAIAVRASATFYETMVDGVEDSGLPKNTSIDIDAIDE